MISASSKMHRVWIAAFICASSIASAPGLRADEDYTFLDPYSIRTAYEQAQSEWQPTTNVLRDAFLVAEDVNFYDRPPVQSTITTNITYWYPKAGMRRSFAISAAISRALSHDEILEWFMHGVFLGRRCFGVDGAAVAYFGKKLAELELHEAAFLAALVAAPARYQPDQFADLALKRRNHILQKMASAHLISEQEKNASMSKPLSVRTPLGECILEPR